MSTKMSNDLNITRPTSRVLRAPGGGSTFSISGGSTEEPIPFKGARHIQGVTSFSIAEGSTEATPSLTPAKKPVLTSIQPTISLGSTVNESGVSSMVLEDDKVTIIDEIVVEYSDSLSTGKVGILIGGNLGVESLIASITKALVKEGITGSVITTVNDAFIMPFAAQKLVKSCDVVIAAAIVSDPSHSISSSLYMSLSQIAVSSGIAIIPAIITRDSLLEAKALLPALSADWAKSAASVLAIYNDNSITITNAPEPVIIKPTVYDAEINDADTLITILRESLKEHGARGITGLSRKFRIADDNGNGKIDLNEFTKMISEHASSWKTEQIKLVFDKFDEDKSGSIEFDEFLITLRGQLNERRYQLVLMAFEILDSDHSGIIELNDITAKYNAQHHPDVLSGKRTTTQVLREFLDTFDSIDKDGKVTPQEFCKYYSNVSASIDDDDYFELMIRNAWHISGGEGWCENTTCRRVLVGFSDNHQAVVEIKNDIGLTNDDKQKMIDLLVTQGVNDIVYIEIGDGIKYMNNKVDSKVTTTTSVPVVVPQTVVPAHRGRYGAGGGHSTLTLG